MKQPKEEREENTSKKAALQNKISMGSALLSHRFHLLLFVKKTSAFHFPLEQGEVNILCNQIYTLPCQRIVSPTPCQLIT